MLASTYALGARGFDAREALRALVRGADRPCHTANGDYTEREALAEYLRLGYMPHELDVDVIAPHLRLRDRPWGATATTLEYALADFAISRLALARGERALGRALHPAGGHLAHAGESGEPHDPAAPGRAARSCRASHPRARRATWRAARPQYSWLVPHDPAGLFASMGGRAAALARLDCFFTELNAGPALGVRVPQQRAEPGRAVALRLARPARPHPARGAAGPARALRPRPGRAGGQRRRRDDGRLVGLRRAGHVPGGAGHRRAGAGQPAVPARGDPAAARHAAHRRPPGGARDAPTSARSRWTAGRGAGPGCATAGSPAGPGCASGWARRPPAGAPAPGWRRRRSLRRATSAPATRPWRRSRPAAGPRRRSSPRSRGSRATACTPPKNRFCSSQRRTVQPRSSSRRSAASSTPGSASTSRPSTWTRGEVTASAAERRGPPRRGWSGGSPSGCGWSRPSRARAPGWPSRRTTVGAIMLGTRVPGACGG